MKDLKEMKNQLLIDGCVALEKQKKALGSEQDTYKAEIQARGISLLDDRNIKYCQMYGTGSNMAAVSEAKEVTILNMDKLKDVLGEGLLRDKVAEVQKITYKIDRNLEKALKAIFTGDYTFEYTLEEFLDNMSVPADTKQKALLSRKLKGDYKADKKTMLSVLGYLTKENTEREAETLAPDFDVELYYISKIKNAELIQAYLPEDGLDWTLAQVRKCILVEATLKIELAYNKEETNAESNQ